MTSQARNQTSAGTHLGPREIETESIACPLCASDDCHSLFKGRDRLHGLDGEFTVVQCNDCGLAYLNPRPTRERMSYYYPEDYQPHSRSKEKAHRAADKLESLILTTYYGYPGGPARAGGRAHRLVRKMLLFPFYLKFRADLKNARVLPFVGDGRLLDVGCGSGRFLSFARAHGWDALGIDTSCQAVDYARGLGLDVVLGDLTDLQLEDDCFDVVRMWHVLEHFYDPLSELREAHRVLKDSGMLVVAVPNIDSFAARRFRERWFHLDLPRHLCNFSKSTVGRMLAKAGFDVISTRFDRGASGVKGSLRYLAEDGRRLAGILAERKYVLRIFNLALAMFHQGDVIIVYAKKRRRATSRRGLRAPSSRFRHLS